MLHISLKQTAFRGFCVQYSKRYTQFEISTRYRTDLEKGGFVHSSTMYYN